MLWVVMRAGRAVALLTEGVDRNHERAHELIGAQASPSSRRAWIEIGQMVKDENGNLVALLTEGVDRNLMVMFIP